RFVTTDPISKKEYEYLKAYICGVLEPTIDSLKKKLTKLDLADEPLKLIGTSGTIECLVLLVAMERTGVEPDPLNGYRLTYDELSEWINRLRKMPASERLNLPGMSERRAEIIVAGALILQSTMELLGVDQLKICERALREGVVVDWMLTHGLIENRMAYQDSIRDRSVRKLARKYRANGDAVAAFATSLFNQLQGILHNLGPVDREYLWAAAMLHNSGHYVSHSAHHKHSYYLIRNGGLLGFTEAEVEIIGNIARYHRKSLPKRRHDNYNSLPSKNERRLVDQLSAILRIAVALNRARRDAIASVTATLDESGKYLTLTLTPAETNYQCDLELWNIDYKKAWFETVFGVGVQAQVKESAD
ncbi:MAG: Ppx/GppA phosphatase family protein, partial [Cyanobacteria bacterium J06643_4]